jgi:hypothetical protein
MGKGMLSLQPYYSEKFLLSKVAMSGVLVFLTSLFDIKSTFLLKHHYFIYFLSLAMYPKSLFVVKNCLILVERQIGTNASEPESGSGSRCRGPGRKAQENHRIPDTYFASAYRKWRKSRTCHRRIRSNPRLRALELRYIKKEPRLRGGRKAKKENQHVISLFYFVAELSKFNL